MLVVVVEKVEVFVDGGVSTERVFGSAGEGSASLARVSISLCPWKSQEASSVAID